MESTREVGVNKGPRRWRRDAVASVSCQGKGQCTHFQWLGIGVPPHATEPGLCAAGVMSATADDVSNIKCVTGAHPFPSET